MGMLSQDHHVHSTFSDDARSTVAENLAAASARGVTELCLADHVRADTPWLAEFTATVRAGACADLTVHCGVETKLMDRSGRLDLPRDLTGVDRVLIADHQYPGPDGPISPTEVRRQLDAGQMSTVEVVDTLVEATATAMVRVPRPQLAHLFSLLPKLGLTEEMVGPNHLEWLADTARRTGAVVEVNEKWHCPGPRARAAFTAARVPVVASTDSHQADDIAVYDWVAQAIG